MKSSIIKYLNAKVPKGISKQTLQRGIRIEQEHTNNKRVAKAIAIAHLKEFPKYYDKKMGLPAFEKSLLRAKRK